MRHIPPPGRRLRAGAGPAVVTLPALTLAALGLLGAGCSSSASPAAVPSLSSAGGGHSAGGNRAAQLHAAAQCIRQHGVPGYADPVAMEAFNTFVVPRMFLRVVKGEAGPEDAARAAAAEVTRIAEKWKRV